MLSLLGFLATPMGGFLARALGILAIVGVVAAWGYQRGYQSCQAAAERAAAQERLRQADVNERARAQLETQLQVLRRTGDQLLDQLSQNEAEARSDASAVSCGLSVSGVVRHNRLIGRSAP